MLASHNFLPRNWPPRVISLFPSSGPFPRLPPARISPFSTSLYDLVLSYLSPSRESQCQCWLRSTLDPFSSVRRFLEVIAASSGCFPRIIRKKLTRGRNGFRQRRVFQNHGEEHVFPHRGRILCARMATEIVSFASRR